MTSTSNSKNPHILFIPLEFPAWADASHWSYIGGLGLEEGLEANGAEYLTIPAMYKTPSTISTSWLNHARRICAGRSFDQVWLEISHSDLDEPILDWLSKIARTRVGFICESLETDPGEWVTNPKGTERRLKAVERALPYLTHVIAVDEVDVESFNAQGHVSAMWWASGAVPERFICEKPLPVSSNSAVFYGALYGARRSWLEHPSLQGLLVRPEASPEQRTELPRLFDELHAAINQLLHSGEANPERYFSDYMLSLRRIRSECFALWLTGLQSGCAVVNLPQAGKAYASRVLEGMAAGRPVISWEIPERPRTKALFEDGKEILLYSKDNPEQLASHILRILREPDFAEYIVNNANRKIRRFHTCESQVGQILSWIACGSRPACNPSGHTGDGVDNSSTTHDIDSVRSDTLAHLRDKAIWKEGDPLRLHLGCGEQYLEGYVNIDFPPSEHSVMDVKADLHADIVRLEFPPGSVDEIRLHHVFEHFNRVTALALLIQWHTWLKVGGRLRIETPDLIGSAQTLLSNASWKVKSGVVRHLVGDQAAPWAYHIDQWFPERFERTLKALGYTHIEMAQQRWPHEPYLSNVDVLAMKEDVMDVNDLLRSAEGILRESLVADSEESTYRIWCGQLRRLLHRESESCDGINATLADTHALNEMSADTKVLSLDEIHDFNQRARDRWIAVQAKKVPSGSFVVDVGAGTCPYRQLFGHCIYKAHDFNKYEGEKLGGGTAYGAIDYVSDILALPLEDMSVDVVLCTEVLEHVPDPVRALRELVRVVKPGGKLILTAPLGSGLHQLPFHYYGGFSPEWYRHFAEQLSCEVNEITPNGGFFKLMAQESARVANLYGKHPELHGRNAKDIYHLFLEQLPRLLFEWDTRTVIDQFTVGYHVVLTKKSVSLALLRAQVKEDPTNIELLLKIASQVTPEESSRYYLSAYCLNPNHPRLQGLDIRS